MACECVKEGKYLIVRELCAECQALADIANITNENMNTILDAKHFLSSTDYKVLRHRDETVLGFGTTLTEEEYLALLQERADARFSINELEVL